jgi:sugar phosphate isomerase/epimerase
MKLSQVGAQLYTVRDHLKGLTQFAHTVDRLKRIGYSAVELIHLDSVTDHEIANICDAAGIAVAAAHIRDTSILEQPESVAEKLQIIGSKIAVYAFPRGVNLASALEVEKLADGLEQSAGVLNRYGLTLAYHNHALEFARVGNERVYDVIRSRAPGLSFELDAYWAQYGGMNPESLVRSLGAKLVAFHLKDFGVASEHAGVPFMTEVGSGNLDFRTLISEAESGGCQWFIVEQDVTPGDPFDSLERSFRYIHDNLAAA